MIIRQGKKQGKVGVTYMYVLLVEEAMGGGSMRVNGTKGTACVR